MQTLDELKLKFDQARARSEAWKQAIDGAQLAIQRARLEKAEVLNEPGQDMAQVGRRINELNGTIAGLEEFRRNFADSGLRHEVSTRHSNAGQAYHSAKRAADESRQKLVDLEFAAQQATTQLAAQQATSIMPAATRANSRRVAAQPRHAND